MRRRWQTPDDHPGADGSGDDGAESPLLGRAAVLDQILRESAPLCVVTGDAGIGKTALLERASRQPELAIASRPHQILQSEPFEHAFVVALADALTELARERGRARELAASLSNVLVAVGQTAVSDVPGIVVSALLTSLLPGLGDPIVSSFKALRKRLKPGGANALAARAGDAVSPLVVETLAAILEEAANLASPASITLILDDGEHGAATDRRLLGDLADRLPPGCRILLGYRTGDLESDESLRDLLRRADRAAVTELDPLDASSVVEWLAADGISGADAERILALTEGNPLLLGDVMLQLRAGQAVAELPPTRTFVNLTESSWHSLSSECQRAARMLAVFDQALPQEDVLELLGLDITGWAQVLGELRRARIAIGRPDGAADMHRLRRRVIVEQLLEPFELPHLFADAATTVQRLLQRTGDISWLAQYASLVERAEPLRSADPLLDAICRASDDELRVLASVMELQSTHRVALDGVTYYASAIWQLDGHITEVLSNLVAGGLVSELRSGTEIVLVDAVTGRTESHPEEATYAPAALEPPQRLLFLGRCVRRLGRVPVDALSLASAAWFAEVTTTAFNFRPGRALNRELLKAWTDHYPGPALLVNGRYGAIPLCAVVWFETETERDNAAKDVRSRELLYGRLEADLVVVLPMQRLPALRWLRAVFTACRTPELLALISDHAASRWLMTAENLVGVGAGSKPRETPGAAAQTENAMAVAAPEAWLDESYLEALAAIPGKVRTPGEALEVRAELERAVWNCSGELERFGYEMRPRLSWHYASGPEGHVELAVAGAAEGVFRHDSLPSGSSIAARTAIRTQLGLDYLSTELFLLHANEPPGRIDPVIDHVVEYRRRARAANRGQRLRTMSLLPGELAATVADGVRGWYEDAKYLEHELEPLWTPPAAPCSPPRVLLAIALESRGLEPPGWHSTAICAATDSLSGETEVEVRFIEPAEEACSEEADEYIDRLLEIRTRMAWALGSMVSGRAHGVPIYSVGDSDLAEQFPEDSERLRGSDIAAGFLVPVVAMLLGHDWWDLAFSW